MEIIVYICTARGLEVKSCEDADNNIVMRRRTQQPGIYWPSDAGPGLGGVRGTIATRRIHCLHSSELQTSVFVVHCPLSTALKEQRGEMLA